MLVGPASGDLACTLDAADAKRDPKTGFSRSEARALLRALADEDYVRPLTDKAVPEGTYKNW